MTALKIPGEDESLEILLLVNNQQYGPYTEKQIRQFIISYQVSPNTLAWWEGLPEWSALEDLPKFSHLITTPEPQTAKSEKSKRVTPPFAAMKCLAIGLWLVLAGIVLTDVLAVRPALNLQEIPAGIGYFFHAALLILPVPAVYLMFHFFCPKYFNASGIAGLAFLWALVSLGCIYLNAIALKIPTRNAANTPISITKDPNSGFNSPFQSKQVKAITENKHESSYEFWNRVGFLSLAIPFMVALFHGWKQGIIGWQQSYRLALPANGRSQVFIGLTLMLVLTCAFAWGFKLHLVNYSKFHVAQLLSLVLIIFALKGLFRGINKIFSFGAD